MPDGGNIGQLNNELIGAYGKGYAAALGFGDFKALLAAVPDIRVSKNRAYSAMQEQAEESAEADVVIEKVP